MTQKAVKPWKRTLSFSVTAAILAGHLLTAGVLPQTVNADTILVPDIELKADIPEELTAMAAKTPTGSVDTPAPYMEMPPVVFSYMNAQGEKTVKHHISTGSSFALNVKPGKNIMLDRDAYDFTSIRQDTKGVVTWQDTFTDADGRPTHPQTGLMDPDHSTRWRRTYYGSMGGVVAKKPDNSQDALLVFMHGENKNATYGVAGEYQYTTNTVQTWGKWDTPAQGTTPIPDGYQFDQVYSGFIGLTWSAVNDLDGNNLMDNDMGPIVWPSGGYIAQGSDQLLTYGVRHPYAIEKDGYIYLYYIEDQYVLNRESGRNPGLKVARAPVDNYGPGNWKTWYNGKWAEDALPAGFDKNDREFVYEMGGRSDVVIQPSSGVAAQRFAAAKLMDTDYYLGIAWDRYQNSTLYLSTDLVNWQETSVEFPDYNGLYGYAALCYPQLYNTDCSSTGEIDPDNFWIIGSQVVNGVPTAVGIPMSIDIKMVEKDDGGDPPDPPDKPDNPGDDDVDSGNYTDTMIERFDINTDPIPDPEGIEEYISRNPVPKVQGEKGYHFVYYPLIDGRSIDYTQQKDMALIETARRWRWTMPASELGDKEAALWDWVTFTTSLDYAPALQFAAPKSGKYHVEFMILTADSSSPDNPDYVAAEGSGDGVIIQFLDKEGSAVVPEWDGDDFYAFHIPDEAPTTMEGWNAHWRQYAHIVEFDMVLKKNETVTIPILAKDSKAYDNVYFLSNIGRYATEEELAEPPDSPDIPTEPTYTDGPVPSVSLSVEEVRSGAAVNFGDAEIVIEEAQIPLADFQADSRVVFTKVRTPTDNITTVKVGQKALHGQSLVTYEFRMYVMEHGETSEIHTFERDVLFALGAGYDWELDASHQANILKTDSGPPQRCRSEWDSNVLSFLSKGMGRFTVWIAQDNSDFPNVPTGVGTAAVIMVALVSVLSFTVVMVLRRRRRPVHR